MVHDAYLLAFQSTHPVRGGTIRISWLFFKYQNISIHPPREGWDRQGEPIYADMTISIHPPREGWDEE